MCCLLRNSVLLEGLVVAVAFPVPARADVTVSASDSLPFTYAVEAVEDVVRGGEASTVVTVSVSNGDKYVRSIRLSCEAENPEGYTWDVKGTVDNLQPGEARTARIVSDPGEVEYFAGASRLSCVVSGFEGGLW